MDSTTDVEPAVSIISIADAVSAADAMPADNIDSGDVIDLDVESDNNIKKIKIAFKSSNKHFNKNKKRILIIFLISFLKSSRINLFNNIINSFKIFIIIIIFVKDFLNSFKVK